MQKGWRRFHGVPVPAVLALAGLFLAPVAHAQKTVDRTPFREMNLDRPSAQILVLNEAESPLVLSDGKVQSGGAGGKRVLQFKVKNRTTDDVSAYIVVAFVFDPDGRLVSSGALPPGGKVKPGKSVTGEMPLEVLESQQSPRGFVLLALHEAQEGEVVWRRERDALEEAAQRAVAARVSR